MKSPNSTSTIHLDGHPGSHRRRRRNYTSSSDANGPDPPHIARRCANRSEPGGQGRRCPGRMPTSCLKRADSQCRASRSATAHARRAGRTCNRNRRTVPRLESQRPGGVSRHTRGRACDSAESPRASLPIEPSMPDGHWPCGANTLPGDQFGSQACGDPRPLRCKGGCLPPVASGDSPRGYFRRL